MAPWRKSFDKLSQTPENLRAENLLLWAATIEGAERIESLTPRSRVRVAGVVEKIRINPQEGAGSIEASITDGTGELVIRWLGRSSMPGISLRMGLVVQGTVGSERRGGLVIINPEYDLIPGPEHG